MSATHDAEAHDHSHGVPDPIVLTTQRGIWAVKWSCVWLLCTALIQAVIVWLSGSVALLADTLHNVGDAATALPLWLAFSLARRPPSSRFTYGYGRAEDLAGVFIVVVILGSGLVIGFEAIDRFRSPQPVQYLGVVAVAAVIGFLGNEGVARLRIKVGREIGSAALMADGQHARADALTSLAVLAAVAGSWFGLEQADAVVGLGIALVILRIAWVSGKSVLVRLVDAVDPDIVQEIREAARGADGVAEVTEVRVRWLGHRLHAELNVAVKAELSIEEGHHVALAVRHALLHQLRYLSNVMVHVDPITASGEAHHRIAAHTHDELPSHSH
ncbi:MAG: cation diffusion facilitator family transporter [Nitrospirales bacterium]